MAMEEISRELRHQDKSVIRQVASLRPTDEIAFEDEGWGSRVYIVNQGSVVFKFPRSEAAREQYRHEIAALRLLATEDSPIRIPRVKWQGPDLTYFGYEGIVGEPLSRHIAELDEATKVELGTRLGAFLKLLHGAELEDAPTMTIDDEIAEYHEKYHLALPTLGHTFPTQESYRQSKLSFSTSCQRR
jgi:Phosphotransferase enzyme family